MFKFKYRKILLFFVGFILISVLVIVVAPLFIKPEAAQTFGQSINSWWAISTAIQYLIYIGISFYLVPSMARKRQQPLLLIKEELNEVDPNTLNTGDLIQFKKEWHQTEQKLKKIDQLSSIKVQIFIFALFVVFDLIAGQLPFIMFKGG